MKTGRNLGKILTTAIIAGMCIPTAGTAQVMIGGQWRPRAEYRWAYRTLPPEAVTPFDTIKSAFFVSQRTRLNIKVQDTSLGVTAFLSLQDVRTWGDEAHLLDVPSAGVHEAWAEVRLCPVAWIKVGRMELVYDDHRLLGNVNWTQQARSHDAALLKVNYRGWQVHLGGAYNQERENLWNTYYNLNNYKTLAYLWLNKKLLKEKLSVSFYALSDGFETADTTMVYRFTVGPHLVFKAPKFGGVLSLYYQTGEDPTRRDIGAYMASLQLTLKPTKMLAITAGIDWLSGDDATDTARYNNELHTFHTLYATNHKWYGHMDYFLNTVSDTRRGGLRDIYLKIAVEPLEKLSLYAHLHHFALTGKVLDPANPTSTLDPNLGVEADLGFKARLNQWASLSGGFSLMSPTSSLEAIKGGLKTTGQWGWLMLDVTPSQMLR